MGVRTYLGLVRDDILRAIPDRHTFRGPAASSVHLRLRVARFFVSCGGRGRDGGGCERWPWDAPCSGRSWHVSVGL